ncbi:MAG: hypothetical protein A2X42_01685 [Candidatus Margulisbacteria bacterium GWF2_38_17]|nr:MAG: hypothetical protein A2X43_02650 [Candidatus Margulisbacteria bacterium GWD2_39_127]OGI02733.1 MAG: hypothetical protein A2X42_01685 [Candidatus Margulisbacteria bacterium GWF2_38_17]OGI09381.1 MAG: hypothetical protein A2X41_09690 [Candidatus Margulisbacteria bacterium GWE2_39_32]
MAGKIKMIIDRIVEVKTNGVTSLVPMTKAKLILIGINPLKYDETTADDPDIIDKLIKYAKESGIEIASK